MFWGPKKVGILSMFGHLSSWLGCRAKNAKNYNSEVGGDLDEKVGGGSAHVGGPV